MKTMKKAFPILLCVLMSPILWWSCSPGRGRDALSLYVQRVQSERVWFEIQPENGEFYYVCGVIAQSDFNTYSSDKRFIEADYNDLVSDYEEFKAEFPDVQLSPIEELYFDRGDVFDDITRLDPETDYYLYAYCLDSRLQPLRRLFLQPFTTPTKPAASDITFSLAQSHDSIFVLTPSNADDYIWEVGTPGEGVVLGADSFANYIVASVWFSRVLDTYYEYDFIDYLAGQGAAEINLADVTSSLDDGDDFFLGCVGYSTEETSDQVLYHIVYHPGTASEIYCFYTMFPEYNTRNLPAAAPQASPAKPARRVRQPAD